MCYSVSLPCLLHSHLSCCYPLVLLDEDVEMLGVPIVGQARRRLRIGKLVKGADEDDVVVSDFHKREGLKSWHTVEEGDKAFLHPLDKCLSRPWNEVV